MQLPVIGGARFGKLRLGGGQRGFGGAQPVFLVRCVKPRQNLSRLDHITDSDQPL